MNLPSFGADSEIQVYAVHTHFSFPPSLAAQENITRTNDKHKAARMEILPSMKIKLILYPS